jgi:hypothetical protein
MCLVIKRQKEGSPAVTLEIDSISVDIVLAVRLMEWPSPARDWRSRWLGARQSEEISNNACAVAKIHPDGEHLIFLPNEHNV